MFRKQFFSLLFSFVLICVAAHAQKIKQVPIEMTSPASGVEMYNAYCAACHGTDGKGNGPAASAMKKPPTNLTTLTQLNAGKYPELKVVVAIKGDSANPAHGSNEMPVWGQVFRDSVSHGSHSDVQMRIANLTAYVKGLQEK